MLYFIERLLYRLSISKYSDVFILKGGLFLYTILDENARATKDVDMLAKEISNQLDSIKGIFLEISSIDVDDGVKFINDSIEVERIKEDADYEGVRVKLLAKLDNTKKILQLDIGFGDVIVPEAKEIEYPSLLKMEKTKVKAYSVESVIAEKFEAMVYLGEFNSRMKDFYDIYSLSKKFDFDGPVLQKAIVATFKKRGVSLNQKPHIFTTAFINSVDKKRQWESFKKRIKFQSEVDFETVMKSIVSFLEPVIEQIDLFEKCWSYSDQKWK
ncbi:nucleotidyl transferase AbiEii/AbiGii toxin family protein [Acetobacterium malicum]|nr:nucleotidyl transferase AbiEii/AbiGii toxin family protein [Acetobacterium malicum]